MSFHEDIAAIKAGIARSGASDSAEPMAGPLTRQRDARRMFDALARQFDVQVGARVICLPMAAERGSSK